MNKNTLVWIAGAVVLVVAVVAIATYMSSSREQESIPAADSDTQVPAQAPTQTQTPTQSQTSTATPASTEQIITYTDSGFSPKEMTVKKGTKVTYKNDSSAAMWPASAMHPTHTVYPGSNIQKCGTSEESMIFDACQGIQPGGSWSFTFNEVGSWGYHDHLKSTNFGKVIVTE
ncbi:MAG: hypothetical protein HY432_03080 [Candidatus Liptonbacteria bacterium]|nr:hypothetical protein [Candidatus Liptonbacteria bacterium]